MLLELINKFLFVEFRESFAKRAVNLETNRGFLGSFEEKWGF